MASQYTYAPPPPPPPQAPIPPQYRGPRRSIAGPLVLIIIGLVFLLRNVGVNIPIWRFLGNWWPALLILWGVIALIEHQVAYRQGYRPRHLGAGGILLLILLVVVGVSAHHSSDIDWGNLRQHVQMDDDLGGIFGTAYTFDDTLEQSFPAKGSLRIVCDHGSLNIAPADGNVLRVVVHKKVYANSQNDADKYNQSTKPQITVEGTAVVLNANTNGAGEHGVESDMDIFVPSGAMLDISSRRGDIRVDDHKSDVRINLQHGDVAANDMVGALKLNIEKGSVRASKIAGDVELNGHVDDVTIDEVSGAVHLRGEFYEEIRLSKIAGAVTFNTSRSDMEIASVPGEIEIAGDSMRANDIKGPSRVVTRAKDIRLEAVSGDLTVEDANGDIDVHTVDRLPVGRINITGKHGDITLTLPSEAGFQIDATTNKGDITSDFGGLKVDQTGGGASRASGTIGNGASKLQINADTGDIRIAKS